MLNITITKKSSLRLPLVAAVAVFCISLLADSLFANPSYTFDLAAQAQPPLPTWLDAITRAPTAIGGERLTIPLRPPADAGHLAVTLIYREKQKQTLTVSWQADGDSKSFVVAKNIIEGLDGVLDQRTLVLDHALINNGGNLFIESSSLEVLPTKIVLTWVDANVVLTSNPNAAPALIANSGQQVSRQQISGRAFAAEPDNVGKQVVDATLIDTTESLDDTVSVEAPLSAPVRGARIFATVLGVPLNVGVSAYVNGNYVGELQMEMPGLDDPGYTFDKGLAVYAGWRNASLTVPGSAFKPSQNIITFAPSASDAKAALTDPAYIRDGRLQVIYDNSLSNP